MTIVTYNSGRYIKRCLESVSDQRYPRIQIVVVDNASTDDTIDILELFEGRCQVFYNKQNIGFAAAQNQAIRLANGDWILTLNPDVLLTPLFIQALVDAGQSDPSIGAVCGKLLSMTKHFEIPDPPLVDSTGIYFNPMLRHFDRGSREVDNGHYLQNEYVFGATAAAALYRRRMIEDISIEGEFFDSDFFAYREDADVAWRAQLLAWKCLYVPEARGYHVRTVLPGNRRAVSPELNMHCVKNRFLMRIKNISSNLYARCWFSITARDLAVVIYCLLWEHTSLKAFWYVARNLRRALAKRSLIQARRRVDDQYLASWFQYSPVSKEAPTKMPRRRYLWVTDAFEWRPEVRLAPPPNAG